MDRPAVSPEIFAQAVDLQPQALQQLLEAHYPVVYRLACGLSGDEAIAREVVRIVMSRSLHVITRWRSANDAENWFLHHTVLVVRRARKRAGPAADDSLAAGGTPEFIAFIRALRSLPFQQTEAFVITHGAQLDHRKLAVAMDCSTAAAANHLVAATAALRPIAGDKFGRFMTSLAANYFRPAPGEPLAVGAVLRNVRRRRIGRAIGVVLMLALIALIAWLAWKIVPILVY